MGGSVGGFVKNNIGRGLLAGATGGLSEFTRKDPFGGIDNPLGIKSLMFGGTPTPAPLAAAPGGQSPTELLSQTGGAPVLAQIAMGVNAKEALAGFLGIPGNQFDEYVKGLNPKDAYALSAVQKQLETIQSNTDLRNKAVQQVVNDFPNITAKIAQDRQMAWKRGGVEFDEATKGAIEHALGAAASKYAVGGQLSSGAMNEAAARVGNENAINKLNYQGAAESFANDNSTRENMAAFNMRLAEVNGLRDFQNTMLQNKASEGFSAAQANLGRIQNAGTVNANAQNTYAMNQYNQENASRNAMFGAIGGLGGSFLGASFLKSSLTPMAAASAPDPNSYGSFNQSAPKTYNTSYGRVLGA